MSLLDRDLKSTWADDGKRLDALDVLGVEDRAPSRDNVFF